MVEGIQFSGGLARPGSQGFFHDCPPGGPVCFFKVEITQPLSMGIDHGGHTVIGVHTSAIACYLRESWPPEVLHLPGHQYKGVKDIFLLSGIKQYAKRVVRTVRIPDPVVRIKRSALVLVYLIVKGTVIASVFRNANRPFKTAVEGSIEYGPFIIRAPLDI